MEDKILDEKDYLKLYNDLYQHAGFNMFLEKCKSTVESINLRIIGDRTLPETERQYLFGLKQSLDGIISSFEFAAFKFKEKNEVKNS